MAYGRTPQGAKKAYDKEALATAWNADIRMKNIWKAIEAWLHNYSSHLVISREACTGRLWPAAVEGTCFLLAAHGRTKDNHSKVAAKTPTQAGVLRRTRIAHKANAGSLHAA